MGYGLGRAGEQGKIWYVVVIVLSRIVCITPYFALLNVVVLSHDSAVAVDATVGLFFDLIPVVVLRSYFALCS